MPETGLAILYMFSLSLTASLHGGFFLNCFNYFKAIKVFCLFLNPFFFFFFCDLCLSKNFRCPGIKLLITFPSPFNVFRSLVTYVMSTLTSLILAICVHVTDEENEAARDDRITPAVVSG